MLVLYNMVHHWQPGAAKLAQDADLDEHTVEALLRSVRGAVSWTMMRANCVLQVGGEDEDVEVDEVAFRCQPFMDGDQKKRRWYRFLGAVRRGSALYYWCELDERTTAASQGGGGPIDKNEVFANVLNRPGGRPLFAPWSVVHTDKAKAYADLHREFGDEKYKHLNLWHTTVRHSRKKAPDGTWLPVQFVRRTKIRKKNGDAEWRKAGTQKKDGFWRMVRRHVSRRAVTTKQLDTVRHLAFFFQFLYWRSEDPEKDAINGRHVGKPCHDMLGALGRLRKRVRAQISDEVLAPLGHTWFDSLCDKALDDLPAIRQRRRRMQKGPP
jgi:hypothetical protein